MKKFRISSIPIHLKMNRVFCSLSKDPQSTVFREFFPVTLVSKALGLFPFKLTNFSGNQVFVTSPGALIYSIILLVLTFINLIYLPRMTIAASNFVNSDENLTADNLQNPWSSPNLLMRLLNGIVMNFMGLFSKINAILYVRSELPRAFAKLKSIDEILSAKPAEREKNMNKILILVGLGFFVGLPGQIISSIFVYMGKSYLIGIYMFGNNVSNFTAVSAEVQFMGMCCLLKSRFDIINKKLFDILNLCDLEKRFQKFAHPIQGIIISKQHPPGIFSSSDIKCISALRKDSTMQIKTRSKIKEYSHPEISISDNIKILRIGHQRLCDVMDQVNRMFQLQLLFSIGGCFLNELLNMYSLFTGSAWSASNDLKHKFLNHPLLNLMWVIYYAIRIVAMAIIASKTTEKAKHSLIHILNIRRSSMDFATKEELTFFYDHITSRKVGFSVAGFFDLDIALLSSIVATGSTYLVMLVQLHE